MSAFTVTVPCPVCVFDGGILQARRQGIGRTDQSDRAGMLYLRCIAGIAYCHFGHLPRAYSIGPDSVDQVRLEFAFDDLTVAEAFAHVVGGELKL